MKTDPDSNEGDSVYEKLLDIQSSLNIARNCVLNDSVGISGKNVIVS